MVVGKDTTQRPLPENRTVDITIDSTAVEQVTEFTYLGATVTSDGRLDRELITLRIGKATGAFNQLNNIWKNLKNIGLKTKIRVYIAAVTTILPNVKCGKQLSPKSGG